MFTEAEHWLSLDLLEILGLDVPKEKQVTESFLIFFTQETVIVVGFWLVGFLFVNIYSGYYSPAG